MPRDSLIQLSDLQKVILVRIDKHVQHMREGRCTDYPDYMKHFGAIEALETLSSLLNNLPGDT